MKKSCLAFALISFLFFNTIGQTNFWSEASLEDLSSRSNEERWTSPDRFNLQSLDILSLRAMLESAPHENQISARNSYATFTFPMPDGSMRNFNVVEYDMIEPKLARKFSHIKTYTGVDAIHGSKIHFNLTKNQLFAVIREKGKTIYIDPYFKKDSELYMSYNTQDHKREGAEFTCDVHELVDGEVVDREKEQLDEIKLDRTLRGNRGEALTLRSYRLAVSGTFEFASYYNGTVEGALDGIVTIVNRVNSVYEREAAIRLVLVGDNDKIIFTNADDDPFEDGNLGQMINQNQQTCDFLIGADNYDMGHVFGNAFYQGLAQLSAVCNGGIKARGGSVASPPFGDSYTVNIVCHEMGHQFSANHTMYHCHNVNNSTAYEPGSGSTIMSYAGICSFVANVQSNADDYYHANSLEAIIGFSRFGGGDGCGTDTDFGNTYPDPILDYPRTSYIPVNTAFRLTGSAADTENAGSLTYGWEQYQTGGRNFQTDPWDIRVPIGNEPIFRSMPPTENPTRYFPSLPRIINSSDYLFEQLPSYARDLKFRFIVRDNAAENGGTAWDEMDIEVVDNSAAGQFSITNFVTKDSVTAGGEAELTWNVADTDLPPLNTKFVDIYLSTDGGQSFPHLVKAHTKNDGSALINIPNIPAIRIRFMIVASNSVYLAVNNRSGVIVAADKPGVGLTYDDQYYQICAPDIVEFDIETYGLAGFSDNVHFDFVGNVPAGATAKFSKQNVDVGQSTILRLDLREIEEEGEYDISFIASADGVDTVFRTIEVLIVDNNFDDLTLMSPIDGSSGNEFVPTLSWNEVSNATNYTVELSDNPNFSNIIYEEKNTTNTETTLDVQLEAGKVYFWRVKPRNACGLQDLNLVSAFQVKSLSCEDFCSTEPARIISQSGTPTVEMSINTGANITVNDLNVTQILGSHQDMGDLRITLEGPDGRQVVMMEPGTCENVSAPTIDMGFDDDAAVVNPNCINFHEGIRFVPDNPLAAMNGVNGSTYKLIIDDTDSGASGKLDSWCFEICGDITPEKPVLVKADSVQLSQFETKVVNNEKLEVEHGQYNAEDLTITIVELPKWGVLKIDGLVIGAGTTLSMQDVSDNKLAYTSQSEFYERDNFSFIVTDPGGGFLGTPTIEFIIGLVANEDQLPAGSEIHVFPNPSVDILNVKLLSNEIFIEEVAIYNIHGKRLMNSSNRNLSNEVAIDINNLASGIYFIQVRSGQYAIVRRFVKQ